MKYSIDLEPPFAFSAYWYAIGLGLILLAVLLRYLFNRIFSRKVESPLKADKLYRETMERIDGIDQSYRGRQLDLRTLHQDLSREVRQYTQLMRPDLANLIGDYYGPEFAYVSQADAAASVAKAKESVEALYQRSLKEKKINFTGRIRSRINSVLGPVNRIAPKFASSAVLNLIRSNTTAWVDSIKTAAEKGDLDSYSVRGQMSKAVKSFVRSASGAKTEKEAFNALENKRKSGQPDQASAAVAAREFFDPDFMYHSSYNPNFAIVKGKELIKTWV